VPAQTRRRIGDSFRVAEVPADSLQGVARAIRKRAPHGFVAMQRIGECGDVVRVEARVAPRPRDRRGARAARTSAPRSRRATRGRSGASGMTRPGHLGMPKGSFGDPKVAVGFRRSTVGRPKDAVGSPRWTVR
jgi:hypothetical protein